MENTVTYLGIDIGGTKVALRAENGTQSQEAVFPWPGPESTAHDDLAALATQVRALLAGTPGPVTSVGIAMPATVDGAGRVTTWPNRPSWTGLDLRGALHPLFPGSEVAWADDGDLAALAEADAAGCRNLVYLGVGTGIGGGLVVDGRPCPGADRGSCEVGHVIVDRAGPRCDCGRHGCVQAIASGPATLRRAARLRGTTTTFDDLGQGLRDDEPWAVAAVQESCAALAVAVVSLNELVHPSLALIGGGFADGLPGFTDRVAAAATALTRPGHRLAPVRAAALGGLSSLRGALLLARGTHSGYGVLG
ncbi:ROK family protein [Streptomyces sp. NBC_01768]|uniref:ROK family protein n=1 Tax=Streptomyces sp. NBC_01768 TaxID=2975938 RepID=UPI002DD80C95|nr:ROK family protein [Streptomyces sp. NBC_01768]WSC33870.1 ROK family protein [Streptomyces sp. NBC_01768]